MGPGPQQTTGDHVELVVTNTGAEIPPYEVEALFKPFYRLGAERLVTTKGAGLGLSIVRSVAKPTAAPSQPSPAMAAA